MATTKEEKIEYLYGVKQASWHNMNYDDALKLKIKLATDLITELLKVNMYERDRIRINKCSKAIEFNNILLSE